MYIYIYNQVLNMMIQEKHHGLPPVMRLPEALARLNLRQSQGEVANNRDVTKVNWKQTRVSSFEDVHCIWVFALFMYFCWIPGKTRISPVPHDLIGKWLSHPHA